VSTTLKILRVCFRVDAFLTLVVALALAVGVNAARAADKVNVGMLRFVSSGPLFLAMERGYFKEQGIDVEPKFFEAAQPIAVAVVSGDIDFGATAFTGGFFNLAGAGQLKIIAAQSKEAKGFEGNAILVSNLRIFPAKASAFRRSDRRSTIRSANSRASRASILKASRCARCNRYPTWSPR
jgi:hypothetical protein